MSRWSRFWPRLKSGLNDGTTLRELIKDYKAAGLPYCSFCKKGEHEVNRLVGGPPEVFICDECLDLCRDILREEARSADSKSAVVRNGEPEIGTGDDILVCSFCARGQHEVDKLVAGPDVFICGACVGASIERLQEGRSGSEIERE